MYAEYVKSSSKSSRNSSTRSTSPRTFAIRATELKGFNFDAVKQRRSWAYTGSSRRHSTSQTPHDRKPEVASASLSFAEQKKHSARRVVNLKSSQYQSSRLVKPLQLYRSKEGFILERVALKSAMANWGVSGLPPYVKTVKSTGFSIVEQNGRQVILGQGSTGDVFLLKQDSTGNLYALKIVPNDIVAILREARFLMHLNEQKVGPIVYGLLPTVREELFIEWGILMEFVGNHSMCSCLELGTLLKKDGKRIRRGQLSRLDVWEWMDIFLQIAKQIKKVHSINILINDLKENNILIALKERGLRACIVDFGNACVLEGNKGIKIDLQELNFEECRTKYPQLDPLILKGGFSTKSTDLYSFGYILLKASRCLQMDIFHFVGNGFCDSDMSRRISLDVAITHMESLLTQLEDQRGVRRTSRQSCS